MNDGKNKNNRHKKQGGLLKGIGHMFRFGKHRKDGIAPTTQETLSDFGGCDSIKFQTLPQPPVQHAQPQSTNQHHQNNQNDRPHGGPPMYQPPPPPVNGGIAVGKRDTFNHRYSHYVNYEELQQQIR